MRYGKRSYKRTSRPRKRSFKRKRTYRRVPKTVKKYVRRAVNSNIETKYKISTVDNLVARPNYNQDTVTNIQWPSQGTTDISRIGDKIRVINIKLWFEWSQAVNNDITRLRLIIVQGKDTYWTATDAILDVNYNNEESIIHAPYQHDLRSTYNVLWDKVYTINGTEISRAITDPSPKYYQVVNFRPKSKVIKFVSGSSTQVVNNIYVMWVSDKGIVALSSQGPLIYWNSIVTFKDA